MEAFFICNIQKNVTPKSYENQGYSPIIFFL